MNKHVIKFYPVGNGDTTLLKLTDNSTILIDCKIRSCDQNGDDEQETFDVKEDLLNSLEYRDNKPYLDLFILTHPDEDHCLGFENHFYTGDPSDYSDSNENQIIIDELWVSSCLFSNASNPDAKILKKEAERRRKLWEENNINKTTPGNKIRMIGYDGDEKFESVPNSIPGDTVTLNEINGRGTANFEVFIHAPFKSSLINAQAAEDKNSTSIILQVRFKEKETDNEWHGLFLTGGDADHYRWEQVLEKSKAHNNEDKLNWHLFQSPHHCSWSYFNDRPYEDNTEPQNYSLEILDYQIDNAFIIASSKKIINEKPNPPHEAAKDEYLGKLKDEENFLNTDTYEDETKPQPIVFEVSSEGVVLVDSKKRKVEAANILASSSIVSGNWSYDGNQ